MKTVYPTNIFSGIKKSPFYYSNFVSTIDGKVQVRGGNAKLYWPIGSPLDLDTLLWLRAHADVLIHGKNTALGFHTLKTLAKKEFIEKRRLLGKSNYLIYMVLSNHPDDRLFQALKDPPRGVKSILVTNNKIHMKSFRTEGSQTSRSEKSSEALTLDFSPAARNDKTNLEILQIGKEQVDLRSLNNYFSKNKVKLILVEGGPTIMASFLKENLIDEMFVTIAPKIFGNETNQTLSMIEGHLFPPDKIPLFKLIGVKNINSELYLRYSK